MNPCTIRTMNTQGKLAAAIADRQRACGVTTTELYKKAGMSKTTFFRKMRGITDFTTSDLDAIAAALDCSIEVLLTPNEH